MNDIRVFVIRGSLVSQAIDVAVSLQNGMSQYEDDSDQRVYSPQMLVQYSDTPFNSILQTIPNYITRAQQRTTLSEVADVIVSIHEPYGDAVTAIHKVVKKLCEGKCKYWIIDITCKNNVSESAVKENEEFNRKLYV